ncbi:High-copy suppressor of rspA [Leclercia adecarboxylata]|uniref:High-copy suppressor of rspA n=1 Tax=Leclercia adecarboxylata TaxID=83655 RepID=A0A4U9HWB6_9ENTR|nr:High-copy suppressor of rspA [Leclercia adecarboxylata]
MTLLIFASLAARYGFRTVFMAGLATFVLTSLGCALATTPEMLIGMRIIQGIGGAATLSIAPAILRSVFPGRLLGARPRAACPCLLPPVQQLRPYWGGTILDTLSWQWLFAINLIPGTLALVLAGKALPAKRMAGNTAFDTPGAVLSATLLGADDHGGEQLFRP